MLKQERILGQTIWVNPLNGDFSLDEAALRENEAFEIAPAPDFSLGLYRAVTFCLEISDCCNLRCSYCFNPNKTGRKMTLRQAEQALDYLFRLFPDREKYFVDLSGNGEPLLNTDLIRSLSCYVKKKSDEIDREVTLCLVTNGTLISSEMVAFLEASSVLYGISLDGCCEKENRHRVYADGRPCFADVLANVEEIKNRQYVGVAVTITNEVFPLVETVESLSTLFKTISIKPVRSLREGFDSAAVSGWIKEYDRLAQRLIGDMRKGDLRLLFCLLNGDDFFGKFILRAFLRMKCLCRCDAGMGRVTVSLDGRLYPCPALGAFPDESLGTPESPDIAKMEANYRKIVGRDGCSFCDFRFSCGGECPAETKMRNGRKNPFMCQFKIHLSLLGTLLAEVCRRDSPESERRLVAFCEEKRSRQRENRRLRLFLDSHKGCSFTEGKRRFDAECPSY